ncbi:MAG: hypothetical protein D6722_25990 [Bacteroidetes bacterium]|nr:MAG: hypothetical protein D6722_25990 [Bacteroidota bacterium]
MHQFIPPHPARQAQCQYFYGPAERPFLAPRGIFLHEDRLLVADTGQNRVFIWNQRPGGRHAPADVVLGQLGRDATGRNAGGAATAATLHYPSGLWTDGQRLAIADAWNHRVLLWHTWPERDGQPADVILGQPDEASVAPNVEGVGAAPSARSLYWPYGLWSDGQRLWVADTGNRRVLVYSDWPHETMAAADAVIGQPDFGAREYDPDHAIWPYSVKVGPGGQLAIADTQYYRVLLWHEAATAPAQPADVIIGQPDFQSNGQNQYGLFPSAQTLNWCYDLGFQGEGLWVADTGNSRLLWYPQIPDAHNPPAQGIMGPPDFVTGSENAASTLRTDEALYWPFHLSVAGKTLAVADTGNHRIVFFD